MLSKDKNKKKTPFYGKHIEYGATMIDFNGWFMPLHYKEGIASEHLSTRKNAGLFDISHMGRFIFKGKDVLSFLQQVLTNNAAALEVEESQYTIVSDGNGCAIDDAYLYRFYQDQYLLVVNAANKGKDQKHFLDISGNFKDVRITDMTEDLSMLSLQGPNSKEILLSVISSGSLPEPLKNKLSTINIGGIKVLVARTGYTGEPLGFELFVNSKNAIDLWTLLFSKGPSPVGLGARDTLRLEAGFPLYGHELGVDDKGNKIPILASSQPLLAVSFSSLKGNFTGKEELEKQFRTLKEILDKNYSTIEDLPKMIRTLELLDKGVARLGDRVYFKDLKIGHITSGTVVPYWISQNLNGERIFTGKSSTRSIALALIDSRRWEQDIVEIEVRGKMAKAVVMPYLLRSEAPPYAYAITSGDIIKKEKKKALVENNLDKIEILLKKSIENTRWRQRECINLIPSEMTPSKLVRVLSVMDPVGRYAEHKKLKAYADLEVFYYQGTEFISRVEELLKDELRKYLGCNQVETRLVSGQMANTVIFSALVDFLNRVDRRAEPKRISSVLNHHIIKGGHLSSQPMGALKDFVAVDPVTEKPAVIDFPTLPGNPYKVDLEETKKIIVRYKPNLIIFGKSLMICREPVSEIKTFIDKIDLNCTIMYDMAHVLGLVGPHFQMPFSNGADIITGSTHKTFFGTQRGIIASDYREPELEYKLWEAIETRTFPGSVSNHHLGTLLGLLMAAYEMNHFKDTYQRQVILNAKTFATALSDLDIEVAGDPRNSFTETHQVVIKVGFSQAREVAKRLENNNIIVNYQASPDEEGFTAAGAIRMGVAEMTRFGMEEGDFKKLAGYIKQIIKKDRSVKKEIESFRGHFLDMKYCFSEIYTSGLLEQLYNLV